MAKSEIFKNRQSIYKAIETYLDLDKLEKLNLKNMTFFVNESDEKISIYILCSIININRYFKHIKKFKVFIENYGICECIIDSYFNFKKELLNNNEYYWSLCKNSEVLFDISNRFKKMINYSNKKKNKSNINKKISLILSKLKESFYSIFD